MHGTVEGRRGQCPAIGRADLDGQHDGVVDAEGDGWLQLLAFDVQLLQPLLVQLLPEKPRKTKRRKKTARKLKNLQQQV